MQLLRNVQTCIKASYINSVELCFTHVLIVGRMLAEMKEFSWVRPLLPSHTPHPYQKEMTQKSDWFQLPIILKNEAKHEDCVDILDEYETILSDVYRQAFGKCLNNLKLPQLLFA